MTRATFKRATCPSLCLILWLTALAGCGSSNSQPAANDTNEVRDADAAPPADLTGDQADTASPTDTIPVADSLPDNARPDSPDSVAPPTDGFQDGQADGPDTAADVPADLPVDVHDANFDVFADFATDSLPDAAADIPPDLLPVDATADESDGSGPPPMACDFPFEVPPMHPLDDWQGIPSDFPERHTLCSLKYGNLEALVFTRAIPSELHFWDVLYAWRDSFLCDRTTGQTVSVAGTYEWSHHAWEYMDINYQGMRYSYHFDQMCLGARPCVPNMDVFDVYDADGTTVAEGILTQCVAVNSDGSIPPLIVKQRVPAGSAADSTFPMGSPQGQGASDEHPQHDVQVTAAFASQSETTNAQYAVFLSSNGNDCDGYPCIDATAPSVHIRRQDSAWVVDAGFADRPVTNVTYYGAKNFCYWVSAYLPTEAVWERMAKGETQQMFPWGDDAADCSRSVMDDGSGPGCGHGEPAAVCSRPAGDSLEGLCDMAGNVREWVDDWYDADIYGQCGNPCEDPYGPDLGSEKVVRGGSFRSNADGLRTGRRDRLAPDQSADDLGFRCINNFFLMEP